MCHNERDKQFPFVKWHFTCDYLRNFCSFYGCPIHLSFNYESEIQSSEVKGNTTPGRENAHCCIYSIAMWIKELKNRQVCVAVQVQVGNILESL